MCQENDNEQNPIIQKILDILYATEVSLMDNWKFCTLLQFAQR